MLRKKKKKKVLLNRADFLSTGSTLLNLACSGRPYGGLIKGKYFFIVGDSASGKTFLILTMLAEATLNKNFADYDLVYDDVEGGALMDMGKFFGAKLERLLQPASNEGPSATIEEFYYNVEARLKKGKPFIYILDSMDSLTSDQENKKFEEQMTAYRRGTKTAGSMIDGKAKKNSSNIRRLISKLRKSGSILIIVSQTRDNVGVMYGDKQTRAGGRSLKFYATWELWTSIKKRLTKNVRGKDRNIGILCKIKVKKNRMEGIEHVVEIPLYNSIGIDEVGSCINFLIEEQHWKGGPTKVVAPEFDFKGKIVQLIRYIEDYDLERDLRSIVTDVWLDIKDSCAVRRKARYE